MVGSLVRGSRWNVPSLQSPACLRGRPRCCELCRSKNCNLASGLWRILPRAPEAPPLHCPGRTSAIALTAALTASSPGSGATWTGCASDPSAGFAATAASSPGSGVATLRCAERHLPPQLPHPGSAAQHPASLVPGDSLRSQR